MPEKENESENVSVRPFVALRVKYTGIWNQYVAPFTGWKRSLIFRSVCKDWAAKDEGRETNVETVLETPELLKFADPQKMKNESFEPLVSERRPLWSTDTVTGMNCVTPQDLLCRACFRSSPSVVSSLISRVFPDGLVLTEPFPSKKTEPVPPKRDEEEEEAANIRLSCVLHGFAPAVFWREACKRSVGEGMVGAALLGANEEVLSFIRSHLVSAELFANIKKDTEPSEREVQEPGGFGGFMGRGVCPLISAAVKSLNPIGMLKWVQKEFRLDFSCSRINGPLTWKVIEAEEPLPYELLRFLATKGGGAMYPLTLCHLAQFGRLAELVREEHRSKREKAVMDIALNPPDDVDFHRVMMTMLLRSQYPDGIPEEVHWRAWNGVCDSAAKCGQLKVLKWARLELEPDQIPPPLCLPNAASHRTEKKREKSEERGCLKEEGGEKGRERDQENLSESSQAPPRVGGAGVTHSSSEASPSSACASSCSASHTASGSVKEKEKSSSRLPEVQKRKKGTSRGSECPPLDETLIKNKIVDRPMKFPWSANGAAAALREGHMETFHWMMCEAEDPCPWEGTIFEAAVCTGNLDVIREAHRVGEMRGGGQFDAGQSISIALKYCDYLVLTLLLELLPPNDFPSSAYTCLFDRVEYFMEQELIDFARNLSEKGVRPSESLYESLTRELRIDWTDPERERGWVRGVTVLAVFDIVARADRRVGPSTKIYAEIVECPSVRIMEKVRALPPSQRPSWNAPAEVVKVMGRFEELNALEGGREANPSAPVILSGLLEILRFLCEPRQRYAEALALLKGSEREAAEKAVWWLLDFLGSHASLLDRENVEAQVGEGGLDGYIEEKRGERGPESKELQEMKEVFMGAWRGLIQLAGRLYLEFGFGEILTYDLLNAAEGGDLIAGLDLCGTDDVWGVLRRVVVRRKVVDEEEMDWDEESEEEEKGDASPSGGLSGQTKKGGDGSASASSSFSLLMSQKGGSLRPRSMTSLF